MEQNFASHTRTHEFVRLSRRARARQCVEEASSSGDGCPAMQLRPTLGATALVWWESWRHRIAQTWKADGSAPASERANDATFFFPTVETHFSDIAHPRTPHSYALRPQSHTLETRGSSQVSGHTRSTTSSVKQRWPSNFRGLRNSRPSARQATLPDEINTLPRPVPVRCTHPESASSCAELWT